MSEEDQRDTTKLDETTNEFAFIKGFRTSVKEDINITKAMEYLLQNIIESIQKDRDKIKEAKDERKSIKVNDSVIVAKQCCK